MNARKGRRCRNSLEGATLYSTLEPCAFHGRTPACAISIASRGIARVVIGMRDPHSRVDGEGIRILREAGVVAVEGVCESAIRRQLGRWVVAHHPGDARRRALRLGAGTSRQEILEHLASIMASTARRSRHFSRQILRNPDRPTDFLTSRSCSRLA